jgi:hypothetical protein
MTAIISAHNTHRLVLLMQAQCVLCDVQTEYMKCLQRANNFTVVFFGSSPYTCAELSKGDRMMIMTIMMTTMMMMMMMMMMMKIYTCLTLTMCSSPLQSITQQSLCVQNKCSLTLRNEHTSSTSCIISFSNLTPDTPHTREPSHIINVPTRETRGTDPWFVSSGW